MKHSLSQFLFGLKSASAPLRSDFGTLGVKAKQNCQSTTNHTQTVRLRKNSFNKTLTTPLNFVS